ncbi:MAG: asparagine synthase (glutamine-hydrolyzing) [DPANN group archaeon]|nr:asparagine synthase (glutamine-hydrolyzing) [DPANN group archaeon]
MCGICGFNFEDKTLLKEMCKTLQKRGPDGYGRYINKNISLGHRRLSIIDLSTNGKQPMSNEDETIWITFNGEIYNYKELRHKLVKKGHKFKSNSDTEVIIHLYEEFTKTNLNSEKNIKTFLNSLNGIFAFAIWDSKKKELILARDNIGIKPLYYYFVDGLFIFASEIKAINKYQDIKPELNIDVMSSYFNYGYVPGTETMFKNIKKLSPGTYIIYSKNNIKINEYWNIVENKTEHPEQYYIDTARKLLEDSAEKQILSDVPVGAFLSGGLDSSSVVALAKKHIEYDFHTYSMGFDNQNSELPYAKIVSEHVGTIHHEIQINEKNLEKEWKNIINYYDEPVGDAAVIPNHFLAKIAKKDVTVILAGEGGDEVFGGYENYKMNLKYAKLFDMPTKVKDLIGKTVSRMPYNDDPFQNKIFRNVLYFTQKNFYDKHQYTTKSITDNETKKLINTEYITESDKILYPKNIKNKLNQMLWLDCKNLLPEKFLMKADKSTMLNSVEERVILLDKKLIEFMFSTPPELKMKNNVSKYILKKAVKKLLPKEIINRKKQGYGTPITKWIQHDFKDRFINSFEEPAIKKIYNKNIVSKIINNINKKQTGHTATYMWHIFAFNEWYRQNLLEVK